MAITYSLGIREDLPALTAVRKSIASKTTSLLQVRKSIACKTSDSKIWVSVASKTTQTLGCRKSIASKTRQIDPETADFLAIEVE